MRKFIVSLMLILVLSGCQSRNLSYIYALPESEGYEPSEFSVTLEDEKLKLDIQSVTTYINGYAYQMETDIPMEDLISVDNYGGMSYIVYREYNNNEELQYKEILLTNSIPPEIDVSKFKRDVDNQKILKSVEDLNIAAYTYVDEGQLYTSVTGDTVTEDYYTDVANTLESILSSLKKTTVTVEDVLLNLSGLGDIKLTDIDCLAEAPGMYYGDSDGILRLFNYEDDVPYIFIASINNPMLMNPVSNLIGTEWNNVYLDKDYEQADRMGYRSFSVMTDEGMYTFKIAETAPEGTGEQLIKALGIQADDLKIDPPYKIGLTADNGAKADGSDEKVAGGETVAEKVGTSNGESESFGTSAGERV